MRDGIAHLSLAAAAWFTLLLISTPANAQPIRSPYRFIEHNEAAGLYSGYIITDPGAIELGPQSGVVMGGRYTIRLNGPVSLETDGGLYVGSRLVWDPENANPPKLIDDVRLSLMLVSAALRFDLTGPRTYHDFLPFVLAGGGAVVRVAQQPGLDVALSDDAQYRFRTSFAGHLGVGTEWFGLGRFTLRGDARLVFWRLTTPDAFLELDSSLPNREWARNLMIGASLSYRF